MVKAPGAVIYVVAAFIVIDIAAAQTREEINKQWFNGKINTAKAIDYKKPEFSNPHASDICASHKMEFLLGSCPPSRKGTLLAGCKDPATNKGVVFQMGCAISSRCGEERDSLEAFCF